MKEDVKLYLSLGGWAFSWMSSIVGAGLGVKHLSLVLKISVAAHKDFDERET
jgi:hypothetical protein